MNKLGFEYGETLRPSCCFACSPVQSFGTVGFDLVVFPEAAGSHNYRWYGLKFPEIAVSADNLHVRDVRKLRGAVCFVCSRLLSFPCSQQPILRLATQLSEAMATAEDTRMSASNPQTEIAPSRPSEFSNEFDYTPMSPLAMTSIVIALLGLSGFGWFYGIFIAAIAMIVSLITFVKIRKSEGAIGGKGLAATALVIATVTTFGASAMTAHAYSTECPEGYERHNFPYEISRLKFNYRGTKREIPPAVEPLLNKKIFIKGYVYRTRTTRNQREFLLLKDQGDCCFGGDPAAYDMIHIKLDEDHESVDFPMLTMVSVAGVLSADPTVPEGQAVYVMEADKCEYARTRFHE